LAGAKTEGGRLIEACAAAKQQIGQTEKPAPKTSRSAPSRGGWRGGEE